MANASKDAQGRVGGNEGSCIFNFSDIPVKIMVGASKEVFYLAPGVLCKAGTFFESALKKDWKEGRERVINLPDDDSRIFRLYAEWLYTGTLFYKNPTGCEDSQKTLVELYILGEKLLDRSFQDCMIDAIIATMKDEHIAPEEAEINRIYELTPFGSPIRALVVDWHVVYGLADPEKSWRNMVYLANREFVDELLLACFEKAGSKLSEQAKIQLARSVIHQECVYHHNKGELCGRT